MQGVEETMVRLAARYMDKPQVFLTPTVRMTGEQLAGAIKGTIARVETRIASLREVIDEQRKLLDNARERRLPVTARDGYGALGETPPQMELDAATGRLEFLRFTLEHLARDVTYEMDASTAYAFLASGPARTTSYIAGPGLIG